MHPDVGVAALLTTCEAHEDVHRPLADIGAWPFVRIGLHFPLMQAFAPSRVPADVTRAFARQAAASLAARGLPRPAPVPVTPPAAATARDGPVVVVARAATHRTRRAGQFVSPVADGWLDVLAATGRRALKLDVDPAWLAEAQPRRHPSIAVARPTADDRARARQEVARTWAPTLRPLLDLLDARMRDGTGHALGLETAALAAAEQFVAERAAAERWLDALAPAAVAFICYYSAWYLPIIAACRSRGIPTFDLQHGMNGTVHTSYTHFTALPRDGYPLLPDAFLTWGAHSAANLTRWWAAAPARPQVLVAGRPDLAPDAAPSPVAAALARDLARAERSILVTLQDKPLDHGTLEAMRATPRWVWLLRPHPSAAQYPEAQPAAIQRQLAAAGVRNALLVPTEQAALEDLLRVVSAHVTHHSSSWMEAWAFGVPTVLTFPAAAELYAADVADGLVQVVPEGAGLVPVLAALAPARDARARHVIETDPAAARRALAALLG